MPPFFSNIWRIALTLCLWLGFVPIRVSAQAATVVETFNLYGMAHVLSHPADMSQFVGDVATIEDAIGTSVNTYNALWHSVNPSLWLDLRLETSGSLLAVGGRIRGEGVPVPGTNPTRTAVRDICHVVVYNAAALRNASEMRFTIAHEMAHCYQGYLVTTIPSTGLPDDDANKWWIEGSAEWLATHVYPEPASSTAAAGYAANFHDNHIFSLIGGGTPVISYDALYFWEGAERSIGKVAALSILANIPLTAAAQARYIGGLRASDSLFSDYAIFAGLGQLPYQPPADDLFNVEGSPITNLPFTTNEIEVSKFSFTGLYITIPVAAENGITLTASGLTASGTTLRLLSGATLADGVPLSLCHLASSQIRFLASRANRGSVDKFRLTIAAHNCPPPAPVVAANTCLYGTWQLTTLPTLKGQNSNNDLRLSFTGAVEITLTPEGIGILRYEDFATSTTTGGQTFKVVLNGTLTNTVTVDSSGHFVGTTPSGTETMSAQVFVNGTAAPNIDVGSYLRNAGSGGMPSDAQLVCNGNRLELRISSPIVDGPYVYQRE
jgi:hypothetical protein